VLEELTELELPDGDEEVEELLLFVVVVAELLELEEPSSRVSR
jgi:hypothetical protein